MSDHELISTLLGSLLSTEPTKENECALLALDDALWVSYEEELDAARRGAPLSIVADHDPAAAGPAADLAVLSAIFDVVLRLPPGRQEWALRALDAALTSILAQLPGAH